MLLRDKFLTFALALVFIAVNTVAVFAVDSPKWLAHKRYTLIRQKIPARIIIIYTFKGKNDLSASKWENSIVITIKKGQRRSKQTIRCPAGLFIYSVKEARQIPEPTRMEWEVLVL